MGLINRVRAAVGGSNPPRRENEPARTFSTPAANDIWQQDGFRVPNSRNMSKSEAAAKPSHLLPRPGSRDALAWKQDSERLQNKKLRAEEDERVTARAAKDNSGKTEEPRL